MVCNWDISPLFRCLPLRELPPTAGLPLSASDLLGAGSGRPLEAELAEFLAVPSVQLESSGTAALVVALECLKQKSARREVIIPAYTCPLVALAVAQAGLTVRLCDCQVNRTDLSLEALSKLVTKDTLCVIPTHMAGLPTDLQSVIDLSSQNGSFVIEDAAQALGARRHGKPVGTAADIGIYSLSLGKGLTVGEGGFLFANDPELRHDLLETSKRLTSIKPADELQKMAFLLAYACFYNPTALKLVYGDPLRKRLSREELVVAVGDLFDYKTALNKIGDWRQNVAAKALKRLPAFIESNAQRGRQRAEMLNRIPGVQALSELPGTIGNWPFIFVLLASEESRDKLMSRLWPSGLGVTRLYIHELSGYQYLREIVPPAPVPNAASVAARSFTISNSHWLTDADFAVICESIAEVAGAEPGSRDLERHEITL